MGRPANYIILKSDDSKMVIKDVGPWDQHMTVTNDAENVVEGLSSVLGTRRLFYYDSLGDYGEIAVKDGEFTGFMPAIDHTF